MAAACRIEITATLADLNVDNVTLTGDYYVTTAPTASTKQYRTLTTGGTEEVLALGDISAVGLVIFKAIDKDMTIDTSFNVTYSAEITVLAGEFAVFKPGGTVYVKNLTGTETPKYEYMAVGTT